MKRNGFTLVELIVVVVVIGVLATLAIPQYTKAVERSKGAKAKYALSQLILAESQWYDYHGNLYLPGSSDDPAWLSSLSTYIEVDQLGSDPDWSYFGVPTGGLGGPATDLWIAATRKTGQYAGSQIAVTAEGVWQDEGRWPPAPLPPPPPPPQQ